MQLMIDTAADTTTLLRRAAQFLITEADARDADESIPVNVTHIRPALPTRETAPAVDTAAIFSRQPAGLDGHGEAKAPPPPPPPVILPLVAPNPPAISAALPLMAIPAASAGTPQSAANPVERDSTGLPYDARIHQTARGKKRDGAWKNQKGIDPALVAAVTAELRSSPATVAGPALAPPPPPVTQVAPPPPAAAAVAAQPGPVVGGPAPLAPGNPTGVTAFRVLMQTITSNTNTGKLTNDEVDAALKSVGLPPRQLISLVQNADKVPDVAAYIDAVLAAKG